MLILNKAQAACGTDVDAVSV